MKSHVSGFTGADLSRKEHDCAKEDSLFALERCTRLHTQVTYLLVQSVNSLNRTFICNRNEVKRSSKILLQEHNTILSVHNTLFYIC